ISGAASGGPGRGFGSGLSYYWLFPLGLLLGAFGTLIGAGGGFLLVPLLLLLYPQDSPETITSISLAVVFFNASSGSVAYARMKRVDYFSGAIFAAAAIPGAMLGAVAVSYIPRRAFDGLFGVILFAVGIALLVRRPPESSPAATAGGGRTTRTVTEADGTRHVFSYSLPLGIGLSVLV